MGAPDVTPQTEPQGASVWTREQWRGFARSYIVGRRGAIGPIEVADACFEAARRGEPAGLVHQAALLVGAPSCWCASCDGGPPRDLRGAP